MKSLKLILILLVSWFAFSCQHDEPAQQGTVQFSFSNMNATTSGGRKQTDEIPDGASLIISITKSNGDSVFSWKKIELLKIGNQFITPPLPLLQGNYVITDFLILGPDNSLLFLTPKQGSPLGALVERTVPIPFSVTTNTVANVDVAVVDAAHKNPEDFGYAAFPIKVVPIPGFSVSVFVIDNGAAALSDGSAYILQGQDTVFRKTLLAATNSLTWSSNETTPYTLVIVKDGYGKYKKEFTLDSLTTQLDGKPLLVVLNPAFTITWSAYLITSPPAFSPNLSIGGKKGARLKVDWGDDIIQTVTLQDDWSISAAELDHTYAKPGKYFISITGDLASINQVYARDYVATIHALSLMHLPELNYFYLGRVFFRPESIDLSKNTKLVTLALPKDIGLTQLDITKNPLLTLLDIQQNHFSSVAVDKIIDDLYAAVVLHNKRNGNLFLSQTSLGQGIVGPPSATQRSKLNSLVNDYGWNVFPAGPY